MATFSIMLCQLFTQAHTTTQNQSGLITTVTDHLAHMGKYQQEQQSRQLKASKDITDKVIEMACQLQEQIVRLMQLLSKEHTAATTRETTVHEAELQRHAADLAAAEVHHKQEMDNMMALINLLKK